MRQGLLDIRLATNSTRPEIDAFYVEMKRLAADPAVEAGIRSRAKQLLEIAGHLRTAEAAALGTEAAVRDLAGVPFRGLGVADAIGQVNSMIPELRDKRKIVSDLYKQFAPEPAPPASLALS